MSSNNRPTAQGSEGRQDRQDSMVTKLAEELDGALDLRNTEDVDRDVTYAPAVTKEVVKPTVHEHTEERITRDIHTHEVHQKILPVKDVEVLPARHWVPGPDGRLVQVDEKDIYSGAAFSQVQQGHSSQVNTVDERKESLILGANEPLPVTGQTQNITVDTVKHTSINPPKVLASQVKQVYQDQAHQHTVQQLVYEDQTHQHTVQQHQIPRKPISNEEQSTGTHIAFAQDSFDQPSNSQQQSHQTQPQRHPVVQKEINRYQPTIIQDGTREQQSVYQTPVSQYSVPEGQVQSRHSLTHQHGHEGHSVHRQDEQKAVDQQLYQEQRTHHAHERADTEQTGQQGRFMHGGQTSAVSQHSPLERDHADAHRSSQTQTDKDNDPVSPGLLDPYRVKNGPVHHPNAMETGEKPLPDVPETHVQKIAGHKILTTEDSSGHSKLHKEPKESKHRLFH